MISMTKVAQKVKLYRTAGLALAWSSLALLLALAATGCQHGSAGESEEGPDLVEVATTYPIRQDLTREVQQPGFLRPYEVTPIYTKIAGFAKEPRHDIGDHVTKDELLVELYVPEVVQDLHVKEARVDQAEADLEQAEENAKAAKANYDSAEADVKARFAAINSADAEVKRWHAEEERSRRLVGTGVFDKQTAEEQLNQLLSSKAFLEETKARHESAKASATKAWASWYKAKADIKVSQANVKVAKAARDQWADWLAYRYITAPFDGVVTLRNVHSGHFLQPSNSGSTTRTSEPLFVLMRTNIMRCVVDVPELDAVLVQDGDEAIIHFDAMPGVDTIGKVSRNAASLDEHTRTLRVEVWLEPKGATINYKVSPDKVITWVDPVPPSGGSGYPRNATIPLLIAPNRDKAPKAGDDETKKVPIGQGALVNATTNADGAVVSYTLVKGGHNYTPGEVRGRETICDVFKPFMYAHVTILGKVENAWSVPAKAVMNDILANDNRSYCFVIGEDGKAHKTFVQVGARCKEGVQILRKLRAGQTSWEPITGKEAVAITNNAGLQDGQAVRLHAAQAK